MKNVKNKFWYRDNWHGNTHEFNTLKEAKVAALKETGVSITIIRTDGSIACFAPASGFCPA